MSLATMVLTTAASIFAVLAVSRFLFELRVSRLASRPGHARPTGAEARFILEEEDALGKTVFSSEDEDWLETTEDRERARSAGSGRDHDWSY